MLEDFVIINIIFIVAIILTWFIFRARLNNMREKISKQLISVTESQKTMETLMYSMAHDLKSPIRSAAGLAAAIGEDLEEITEDEEICNMVHLLNNSLKRGMNNVDDVLDYIKFGQNLSVKKNYNIQSDILDLYDEFANTYNTVSFKIFGVGPLSCDPKAMKRVFQNLIENGIKYNNKSEKFIIITQDKNTITVEDNGDGIEEKYFNRITKPFERLDARAKGSGLGLGIVVKVLELHGYKLDIESKVGEGSKFKILLGDE